MFKSAFYHAIFILLAFPVFVFAKNTAPDDRWKYAGSIETATALDSIPVRQKPADKKPEGKKPDIKEVPKSRRQLKPSAVKGRVKVKPVKLPKPKIIKRKLGPALRLLN